MKKSSILAASLLGLVLFHPPSAWATDYSMRILNGVAVPGFAESINRDGTIFGNSSLPELQIFLWNENSGIANLRNGNIYIGVNNLGQTAGSITNGNTGHIHPRIRSADGRLTEYEIPDGASSAWPSSLSNSGQLGCTVEYRDSANNLDHHEAVLYEADGSLTPIPLGDSLLAEVVGISGVGYVVVRATSVDSPQRTTDYIWKIGAGFIELMPRSGSTDTRATSITDKGLIVGNSGGHAVWWDLLGLPHDLGPGEFHAANSLDQIVGVSAMGFPTLWDLSLIHI